MTSSVSSVSSAVSLNSASSSSSSSASTLSDATKAKLKALGLNPSDYKTEAEAQSAITQAQAQETVKKEHDARNSATEQSIKMEAQSLAAELNVDISNTDTMDDIITKLTDAISSIDGSSDTTKANQANAYQQQLQSISQEYQNFTSSQSMLSNSLSAMAAYNKVAHGLS